MQDLSGTELEYAETELFKQAIADSIRNTMWIGNTERNGKYTTFDGILTKIYKEVKAGNDMKMHCGYPEDLKAAYDKGDLTRAELELCTKRILEMIMKLA